MWLLNVCKTCSLHIFFNHFPFPLHSSSLSSIFPFYSALPSTALLSAYSSSLLYSLLFSALLLFDLDFSDLCSMETCFRNISIKCPNHQAFFKQKYTKDTPLDIFYKSWGNFRQWSQSQTGFITLPNQSDSRNLNDFIIP